MLAPRDRNRNGYIKTFTVWIKGVMGYDSGIVTTASTLTGGEPFRVSSYFAATVRVDSSFTASFRKRAEFAASFRRRSVL